MSSIAPAKASRLSLFDPMFVMNTLRVESDLHHNNLGVPAPVINTRDDCVPAAQMFYDLLTGTGCDDKEATEVNHGSSSVDGEGVFTKKSRTSVRSDGNTGFSLAHEGTRIATALFEHVLSLSDVSSSRPKGSVLDSAVVTERGSTTQGLDRDGDAPGIYFELTTGLHSACGCNSQPDSNITYLKGPTAFPESYLRIK